MLKRLAPTLFLLSYATVLTVLIAFPRPSSRHSSPTRSGTRRFASPRSSASACPAIGWASCSSTPSPSPSPILPVAGYGENFGQHFTFLLLPALTIAVSLVPLVLRALRASVMETLRAGYVDTARAKGLARHLVLRRHVVRNALMPAITVLALNIGYLVGGTVIIENVFAIPGLGSLMIMSIGTRDYPTIQAVTLVFAILVVLVNLATDIIYVFLDPRLRSEIR